MQPDAWNDLGLPAGSPELLTRCESPAEAVLLRALLRRPDVTVFPLFVKWQGATIRMQHQVWQYRIDFALRAPGIALAIEVDGVTFHSTSQPALAKDYLRQRRITYSGYTFVRFTARDVFRDATQCWRDVAHIMHRRAKVCRRSLLRVLAAASGAFVPAEPLGPSIEQR
jgi:very-short-patch-repair endonuclease